MQFNSFLSFRKNSVSASSASQRGAQLESLSNHKILSVPYSSQHREEEGRHHTNGTVISTNYSLWYPAYVSVNEIHLKKETIKKKKKKKKGSISSIVSSFFFLTLIFDLIKHDTKWDFPQFLWSKNGFFSPLLTKDWWWCWYFCDTSISCSLLWRRGQQDDSLEKKIKKGVKEWVLKEKEH